VLYVSLHCYDAFPPNEGHPSDSGKDKGLGFNINIGWLNFVNIDYLFLANKFNPLRPTVLNIVRFFQVSSSLNNSQMQTYIRKQFSLLHRGGFGAYICIRIITLMGPLM